MVLLSVNEIQNNQRLNNKTADIQSYMEETKQSLIKEPDFSQQIEEALTQTNRRRTSYTFNLKHLIEIRNE